MSNKPKATKNLAKHVETLQPNHRQALQLLDNVVALAPVSRQAHIQVQQAISQISRALQQLDAFMIADDMDKKDKEKTNGGKNKT